VTRRSAPGLALAAALAAAVPALAVRAAVPASAVPAAAVSTAAAPPRVEMMVVGRTGTALAPRVLALRGATVTIGHRRCRVPAGTPLAGLLSAHLRIKVTDQGGCDPASMFVIRIGGDQNHGRAGWEYKVGHADPAFGAGDPGGRLRARQELLWYWCVRAASCQRTLSISSSFAGNSLQVRVTGYDQNGRGRPIEQATVHYGASTALTDGRGNATFTLSRGVHPLYATKPGLVRSFATTVGVVP